MSAEAKVTAATATDSSLAGNSLYYPLTVPSRRARMRVLDRIVPFRAGPQPELGGSPPIRLRIHLASGRPRTFPTLMTGGSVTAADRSYDRVLATVAGDGTPEQVLVGEADGKVVVNFNFFDWENFLQHERYFGRPRPVFTRLPFPYFWVPPAVRNSLMRLLAAAHHSHAGSHATGFCFPGWPTEPSLDSLRRVIWTAAAQLAGVDLDPSPYPGDRTFACLLTHDVDTLVGIRCLESIRAVERKFGFTSAWSFLSKRYHPPDEVMRRLIDEKCEVVSHGYLHDGRLPYLSLFRMRRRLQHLLATHSWLRPYVHGVRSGQTMRSDRLLTAMSEFFEYDSTFPDTERDGPYGAASGCCTVFPFRASSGIVEIPLTVPQDFYLLFIHRAGLPGLAAVWRQKLEYIEQLQGCACLVLHPEHVLHDEGLLACYADFLGHLSTLNAWVTTPYELLRFYRARETRE